MGAEESRAHRDGALLREPARSPQRLHLVFGVESVARLDFDGGDAFRQQRVEPRQGLAHELVFVGRAQCPDRGNDAAAGARDFLVGRPGKPHLEFVRPAAGVDQMGVAIDKPRRHQPAAAIDRLGGTEPGRQLRLRTDEDDAALVCNQRPMRNDARAVRGLGHRCELGVAPDLHRHRSSIDRQSGFSAFPSSANMYIHNGKQRKRSLEA